MYLKYGVCDFVEAMLAKIKEKKVEYAIYVVFAIFLVIPICVLITPPDGSQRLLALSVAVAISGVIVSMWSFFRSSEKQDKIVNLKKDELNKKDEEIGELKRANMLNEERLELLKNQVDRQYIQAKNQLKSCLDDFVSIGRGDDIISFGHPKRKELQKKMTDVGNSFKTVIENIEKLILLPQDMLNKAKRIAESIINLSKKIARGVMGVKGEEATEPRDQKVVEEWDELVERAKKLSEELQQDEK